MTGWNDNRGCRDLLRRSLKWIRLVPFSLSREPVRRRTYGTHVKANFAIVSVMSPVRFTRLPPVAGMRLML